ncbi:MULTISPECIES: DUF397 domain-containing protein [unclassified Nocardiopsis]|uniref:DUF397 domain-containing protein n=1 Tax=unclassified Nocardiopsis TaxID=2649073 RepID=UPI0033D686F2
MTNARELPELEWWKSSHSGSKGGDCVEVARSHRHTHLRDSRNPVLGHISLDSREWGTFLATAVRN